MNHYRFTVSSIKFIAQFAYLTTCIEKAERYICKWMSE